MTPEGREGAVSLYGSFLHRPREGRLLPSDRLLLHEPSEILFRFLLDDARNPLVGLAVLRLGGLVSRFQSGCHLLPVESMDRSRGRHYAVEVLIKSPALAHVALPPALLSTVDDLEAVDLNHAFVTLAEVTTSSLQPLGDCLHRLVALRPLKSPWVVH